MRRKILAALSASIAVVSIAETARAQDLLAPAGRQGYYVGGGLRSGGVDMHSETAGNLGLMGGSGFVLRAGEMAGDLFGFGLALAACGGGNKDWGGGWAGLLLDLQLVPMENLALRGGIGLGGLGVGRANKNLMKKNDPTGSGGSIYTLGLSYDYFPFWEKGDDSGGFSLSFFIEAQLVPGSSVIAGAMFMGIEVNYWFGLAANKLALPNDRAFKK
jgi:hypothetical protein